MRRARRGPATLDGPIAVRAYVAGFTPLRRSRSKRIRAGTSRRYDLAPPGLVLVLDAETRTGAGQALTFGSYRVYRRGSLVQEGLFHADDLPVEDVETLQRYVVDHPSDTDGHLRLMSRSEFVEAVLWKVGYEARARIVGFNLPFDLSRLSVGWSEARGTAAGGFSLRLWEWTDPDGLRRQEPWRPRVTIKALGSKRQFIGFTTPGKIDDENRDGRSGYRGRFLDLHTLAYVLTDRSMSLAGAATDFGLSVSKDVAERYGVVDEAHVDYNRQDVRVTHALYLALIEEWDRHPIELAPEQAFSPAAIGKAYLRVLGVTPPRERAGAVDDAVLGYFMTAYYGGRTECRIRGVELPVRYVDFASMYPTVFVLQKLWRFVICHQFATVDATYKARRLLRSASRERLHDPALWPRLAAIVCRVHPQGQLLPTRARYGFDETRKQGDPTWTIGLNHLSTESDLWFTLADLVAAKILGDGAPEVLEAVEVRPVGLARGLRTVRLRGQVEVRPRLRDLFRTVIEARGKVKADRSLPDHERSRLERFLKVLANATSYGVFAEFRQLDQAGTVDAHGLYPLHASVSAAEEPGEFCFPPLAASITGAGRLLLALAQADFEAAEGSYVACDTDSLLVVSSREGGLVACPGGPHRLPDGRRAVRALSWDEVDAVRESIDRLNPYARDAVPSLLKVERENEPEDDGSSDGTVRTPIHDPSEPVSGELYGIATSSKRYVLFNRSGTVLSVRKASEHGLGLFRSPMERDPGWKHRWARWVDTVWRRTIAEVRGEDAGPYPGWFTRPAVSETSVSTPNVAAPFARWNAGRPYREQVKPFGFLLVGHADPLARSVPDTRPVTPVAPYTSDPGEYLGRPWVDRRDGSPLCVTTDERPSRGSIRLRTYGDVVREYRIHPESKSGHPDGRRGNRGSIGLLPRLQVRATSVRHIGKESNRLEEAEVGLDILADEGFTEFDDAAAEWTLITDRLRSVRIATLQRLTGIPERTLRSNVLEGHQPRDGARSLLVGVAEQLRSGLLVPDRPA
jgi:hypothetical protein